MFFDPPAAADRSELGSAWHAQCCMCAESGGSLSAAEDGFAPATRHNVFRVREVELKNLHAALHEMDL